MANEDKPNQTNPADDQTPTEVTPTKEQVIAERVADAMSVKTAQTPAPDNGGSGSDVTGHKDSSSEQVTDPKSEVLKLIEASTGRKFASADEASKYLVNLNSLVGDQAVAKAREEAKLFEGLLGKLSAQTGKPLEETRKLVADTLIEAVTTKPEAKPVVEPKSPEVDKLRSDVEKLTGEMQASQLLGKYPFAAEVKDEIAILAKQKGISQIEAFEQSPFKALLEAKAKEESGKSPVVTPNNRIGVDQKRVTERAAKVLAGGGEDDKVELVKQFGKVVGL